MGRKVWGRVGAPRRKRLLPRARVWMRASSRPWRRKKVWVASGAKPAMPWKNSCAVVYSPKVIQRRGAFYMVRSRDFATVAGRKGAWLGSGSAGWFLDPGPFVTLP